MPEFKVRLLCNVEIAASCEITVRAKDADQAEEKALDEYNQQKTRYEAAREKYRLDHENHPEAPFYWSVDDADVEDAIDEDDIEVDSVEEQ